MANLDWLRGNSFHNEIKNQAKIIEQEENVEFSDYGIDLLIELFDQNKGGNLITESRKMSFEQRSIETAKESVRTILRTAVRAKQKKTGKYITRAELNEAYRTHYCGVWPLCGGK